MDEASTLSCLQLYYYYGSFYRQKAKALCTDTEEPFYQKNMSWLSCISRRDRFREQVLSKFIWVFYYQLSTILCTFGWYLGQTSKDLSLLTLVVLAIVHLLSCTSTENSSNTILTQPQLSKQRVHETLFYLWTSLADASPYTNKQFHSLETGLGWQFSTAFLLHTLCDTKQKYTLNVMDHKHYYPVKSIAYQYAGMKMSNGFIPQRSVKK